MTKVRLSVVTFVKLGLLVAQISVLEAQPSVAQTQGVGTSAPVCFKASDPPIRHYEHAKENVNYIDCLNGIVAEQSVICKNAHADQLRSCQAIAIIYQDLAVATMEYHKWKSSCALSHLPDDCQAQEESDQRLLSIARSLAGN